MGSPPLREKTARARAGRSRWRDRSAEGGESAYMRSAATAETFGMQLAMARAAVVSILALAVASCGENKPQQRAAPPPPAVTISKPVTRTVVDQDEYVGRFIAVDAVEIRARVWGYLQAVHFTDG